MSKSFNVGDHVFIISNGVKIDELTVISVSGNFYTLRYVESGGGTRLASHRLYTSREEARPSSVKLTIGEEDYELSGNK